MKLQKVLGITALGLLVLLAAQVGRLYLMGPGPTVFAAWVSTPKSVGEAHNYAEDVVLGRVVKIRRAKDFVIQAPPDSPEEDAVIRIPIEVVTLRIEKTYKGARKAGRMIEVFHTGLSNAESPSARRPPDEAPPPRPADAVDRPQELPADEEPASTLSVLDGDPPYKIGERHLLFLRKGPLLTVGGRGVQTHAIFSPRGRYKVLGNNNLVPAAREGFAARLGGRQLSELEGRIRRAVPRVIRPIRRGGIGLGPGVRPNVGALRSDPQGPEE